MGKVWNDLLQLGKVNRYELTIALTVLVVIVGLKMVSKKIPGALIAVIGALVASWAFGLGKLVHVVGAVPSGLPHLGLPKVAGGWLVMATLIPTAFAMFVVILAQSAATSRAFATRYDESFSENTDLVGLALANIGAGLSGTFVVNGSPTKAQIVDSERPQPTVAPGDSGDGSADRALPDRSVGVPARGGLVDHRISDRSRPDRSRWDAEDLRATAIGVLVGTGPHRITFCPHCFRKDFHLTPLHGNRWKRDLYDRKSTRASGGQSGNSMTRATFHEASDCRANTNTATK